MPPCELALSVPVDRPAETLGADGKYRPARVVREVAAEVIEEEEEQTDTRDLKALDQHYLAALRSYIAAIVDVSAPAVGQPPLMRRRRAIERALQQALSKFVGET